VLSEKRRKEKLFAMPLTGDKPDQTDLRGKGTGTLTATGKERKSEGKVQREVVPPSSKSAGVGKLTKNTTKKASEGAPSFRRAR